MDDLAVYDDRAGSREVMPGTCEIQLGVSSVDLRLETAVEVM